MDLVLGAAAGVFVAGMCAVFYAKGARDGMDVKKGKKPGVFKMKGRNNQNPGDSEMGRKLETILSYDPFSTGKNDGADEGETV